MHTGIISFCDRIAFNIKCSDAKDWILNELEQKYHLRILQKHWFRLDEVQFKYVQTLPHSMCLRSNGNPYFLYFTRYEDVPQIMYIDKKVQPGYQKPRIILTKGQFSEVTFNNTLLEGEMVKDARGEWIFLINDVWMYQGTYLQALPLPARLQKAYDLLSNHYTPNDLMDVCQYQVKKYVDCSQTSLDQLLTFGQQTPYTNRGLYFMPHSLKYKPKLINFNDDLIKQVVRKVKDQPDFQERSLLGVQERSVLPINEPSVLPTTLPEASTDRIPSNVAQEPIVTHFNQGERLLWLRKTELPDVYDLFEMENALQKIGIASVSSIKVSKMLRAIFKNLNVATSMPFKCQYDTLSQKWIPMECLR